MKKRMLLYKKTIQDKTKVLYKRTIIFVDRRPVITFLILLALLLALIALGNFLRQPKPQAVDMAPLVKNVRIYRIGSSPKISLQAQVEKSGVVTITSLTGGVVQAINAEPGVHVNRGNTLISLSTNYQGGNALSVARQINAAQYKNTLDIYPIEKEIINKKKEEANKTDENSDRMREISAQSIEATKGHIELNDSILSTIDQQINGLEDGTIAPGPLSTKERDILQFKQAKSQLLQGNNSLRAGLRSTEYETNAENPPAKLRDLTREITLKQLEIQEKALELNKEVTRMQLVISQINEAVMFPSSPFNGTVQRVFVKMGQAVSPGTPLMVLSQDIEEDPIVAIAYATREVAQKVSLMEPSVLHIGGFTHEVFPSYITQDAVQGSLYAIYYPLPDNFSPFLTEKGYIRVDIPIGNFDTSATVPYIPIDVVYQTQTDAYIFVLRQGKVEARTIQLGEVYGGYVQVISGLKSGDAIILDRNVIAGEKVRAQN